MVASFQDAEGRKWHVPVNVATVRRVRDLLNLDLLTVVDEGSDLLARLTTDPVLLVDTIFVLCADETRAAGVSPEDFGRAMFGGALDAAATALLEGLIGFFPCGPRALMEVARDRVTAQRAAGLIAAATSGG